MDGCVEVASSLLKDTSAVFDFTHKHQKHSSTDVNVHLSREQVKFMETASKRLSS